MIWRCSTCCQYWTRFVSQLTSDPYFHGTCICIVSGSFRSAQVLFYYYTDFVHFSRPNRAETPVNNSFYKQIMCKFQRIDTPAANDIYMCNKIVEQVDSVDNIVTQVHEYETNDNVKNRTCKKIV